MHRSSIMGVAILTLPALAWAADAGGGLPAFPGAEGYGSTTPGGRGGRVIEVTNLNDHGPGSLRAAVEASEPRTIIFRVSGTITLEKDLEVRSPFCTIAGQTAPGDGICLRKYALVVLGTHDVIVRYVRVRRGSESNLQEDGIDVQEDTTRNAWSENVIIDHCSVSWTCDEGINTWHHARNVTFQWTIVSEALHNAVHVGHGFAATLGGENTTYHHNLLASCPGRNPSIGGNNNSFKTINLDFRNNVVFNWQERTMDGKPWSLNDINNYWKPGPSTMLKNRLVRIDKINSDPQGHWYVAGNFYEGNDELSFNNRLGIETDGGLNADDWLLKEPLPVAPVRTQSAQEAYALVLVNCGANLPRRDPVDRRILEEMRTGKPMFGDGVIQSAEDVGGWPELKSAAPAVDSDHDGIPDWWEIKYKLNPNDPSDGAKDINGDGYTNLEKYLNGLDPTKKIDWRKPENNYNRLNENSLMEPQKVMPLATRPMPMVTRRQTPPPRANPRPAPPPPPSVHHPGKIGTAMRIPAAAILLVLLNLLASASARAATVYVDENASPRVVYGAEQVVLALQAQGVDARLVRRRLSDQGAPLPEGTTLSSNDFLVAVPHRPDPAGDILKPQGFHLMSSDKGAVVFSADDSGALYGCLEYVHRFADAKGLPAALNITDAPSMPIRGTCVAMQKPYKLPGRKVYEYPYTPELFPFFYDKTFWMEYLDFLAKNRMNMLYLWNGHPFASLVRVPDYPYAVEVPDEVLAKNQEMFKYIVAEADRRGIVVMQMFYNILVSQTFAEKNHLGTTQFAAPTPLIADYTRKSIAEFVKTFPKAGLMICLGEALKDGKDEGDPNRQANWMTQVIVPGIHEGMAAAGIREEIPVLLRAHAMPATDVLPQVLKVYKNISTESKYNGESLTTWEPRGQGADDHVTLSKLAPHLVNVHILANLEPFRYGAQRFIKKCVQASEDQLGATGVHLYPLFYWDWPNSPDRTAVSLKQWERDWIWYEAWARYEWNPRIDEVADHAYWVKRIGDMYGNAQAGEKILAAYNDSGECAPRIIRRFGITEGNRQTMSLGMTLDQLVNAPGAFAGLWEWQSPPGERMQEYILREFRKQPHQGETPPQIIREILDYSQKAVEEIDAAAPQVLKNQEEFARLRNDFHCIRAMSESYAAKASAAMGVLRYNLNKDPREMVQAQADLAQSLKYFRELTDLTRDTYKYANGMQTTQRKVPVVGGAAAPGGGEEPANYHWTQLLPLYEKECADFQARVSALSVGK